MKFFTKIVIVAVLIIAGYFIVRSMIPPDPLKPDKSFRVSIDPPPQPPDSIQISNNSAIDVRLHVFNANDAARVIARDDFVVGRNQSKKYPRGSYVFNVWKAQFPDKHLRWTDEVWTDVEFAGNENNLTVQTPPKPPVKIAHDVDEELKVSVYNQDDAVRAVPLKWWRFGKDQVMEWSGGPSRFALKVFRPGTVDQLLAERSDVPEMSTIRISKKPWWQFW
jgi:hypothetical protein